MRPDYQDIIERAGQPEWYDDNGTPRYSELTPDALGVYDDEAVFYTIACQGLGCKKMFIVGEGHSFLSGMRVDSGLERGVMPFYGDPPRHANRQDDEPCAGETMTANTIQVISYWRRTVGDDWQRIDWDDLLKRMWESEREAQDG